MLKNLLPLCFVAFATVAINTQADTSSRLDGLWVVDPKATEDYVLGAPLPPNADKLSDWFGVAGGFMAIFTYEFKGNVALIGTLGPGNQALEYQQDITKGAETRYIPKQTSDSKADKFSVLNMDNGNIRIIQSKAPETGYIIWKRSQIKTKPISSEELLDISKEWMASIENIRKTLKRPHVAE
jgi:hypothetical protein